MTSRVSGVLVAGLLVAGCGTAPAPLSGVLLAPKAVVYGVSAGADAAAWYAQLLGEPVPNPVLGDTAFAAGDALLALDSQAPMGSTLVIWEAADIDDAFARLLALGAEPVTGIQEIGDTRVVIMRDPFGNLLGVMQTGAPQH